MNAPFDLQQALGELLGDARLKVAVRYLDTDLKLWLIDGDNMDREFSQEEIQRILHEPPYWGFCWASGLAMARYLSEFPEWVAANAYSISALAPGLPGLPR
jgi:predicted nicotinamide N-methyase